MKRIILDSYTDWHITGKQEIIISPIERFCVNDIVAYEFNFKGKSENHYGIIKGFFKSIFQYDKEVFYVAGVWKEKKRDLFPFVDMCITPEKYGFQGINVTDIRWLKSKATWKFWEEGIDISGGSMPIDEIFLIARGGEVMSLSKIIVEYFPKTSEAVLVDKWFGKEIESNRLSAMLLKGKEKDIIAEAKKMEAEEENARKK